MPKFRVHEHFAERAGHHYDLRLEKNGKAKSWAIRKEPPTRPGVKRLAVQTKDHRLKWIDFEEGDIETIYGKGHMRTWDKGTYDEIKWTPGVITVFFHGKKLKGVYHLVKTRYGGKASWLFFKSKSK